MRLALALVACLPLTLTGCGIIMPIMEVVTRPMAKKQTFEEIQQGYSSDIRFGLWEQAAEWVEPEMQSRFQTATRELEEIRFSDVRVESIEIDALRTKAIATVVYRGYWLSSPFVQEITVTQHWRRSPPSQQWFVTPDFDNILAPPGQPAGVAAAPEEGPETTRDTRPNLADGTP